MPVAVSVSNTFAQSWACLRGGEGGDIPGIDFMYVYMARRPGVLESCHFSVRWFVAIQRAVRVFPYPSASEQLGTCGGSDLEMALICRMTRVPQDLCDPIEPARKQVGTLILGGGQSLRDLWSKNPET